MKKFVILLFSLILLSVLIIPSMADTTVPISLQSHSTDSQIKILINNKYLICDQPPVVQNGRTLVPLRAIFEALDARVDWNGETQTVTATKDNITMTLTLGSDILYINDNPIKLDVPAQAINGRTLVPVRAVAESFECTVNWNGLLQYVIITAGNQRPYRVEAIDEVGNVVGTAYFNDKGQVKKVVYTKTKISNNLVVEQDSGHCWFDPFTLNINGNIYFANGYENEFFYDEKGNVSEMKVYTLNYSTSMGEVIEQEEFIKTYKFEYDGNNLISKITETINTDNTYLRTRYVEYIGNILSELRRKTSCNYTWINIRGDVIDDYTEGYLIYNSFGMIYKDGLDKYAFTYSYDENYNLISRSFVNSTNYVYDDNQRLISAADYLGNNKTVTYRYIEE